MEHRFSCFNSLFEGYTNASPELGLYRLLKQMSRNQASSFENKADAASVSDFACEAS